MKKQLGTAILRRLPSWRQAYAQDFANYPYVPSHHRHGTGRRPTDTGTRLLAMWWKSISASHGWCSTARRRGLSHSDSGHGGTGLQHRGLHAEPPFPCDVALRITDLTMDDNFTIRAPRRRTERHRRPADSPWETFETCRSHARGTGRLSWATTAISATTISDRRDQRRDGYRANIITMTRLEVNAAFWAAMSRPKSAMSAIP
jgi:hypothetical protein